MGWSCSAKVSDVMRAWSNACVADSGMSNVFSHRGKKYYWEVSRKEHDDGAATGKVHQMINERPDGSSQAKLVGTFRINGDGSIARAPAWLKNIPVTFTNYGVGSGGLW